MPACRQSGNLASERRILDYIVPVADCLVSKIDKFRFYYCLHLVLQIFSTSLPAGSQAVFTTLVFVLFNRRNNLLACKFFKITKYV